MTPTLPEFTFVGFEPDDKLRLQANCLLDDLLDKAPPGAIAVAILEKIETNYRCSVEIYSHRGPLRASSSDSTAHSSLETAVKILTPRLLRWSETESRSRAPKRRTFRSLVFQ